MVGTRWLNRLLWIEAMVCLSWLADRQRSMKLRVSFAILRSLACERLHENCLLKENGKEIGGKWFKALRILAAYIPLAQIPNIALSLPL